MSQQQQNSEPSESIRRCVVTLCTVCVCVCELRGGLRTGATLLAGHRQHHHFFLSLSSKVTRASENEVESESGRAQQQQQPKVSSRVSECSASTATAPTFPQSKTKKTVKNEHTAPVIVIEVMTDGVIENWTAQWSSVFGSAWTGSMCSHTHTLPKRECTFTLFLSQTPDTSHLLKRKG